MRRYLLVLFGGWSSIFTHLPKVSGKLSKLDFNFFEEIESPPISTKDLGETERYKCDLKQCGAGVRNMMMMEDSAKLTKGI